MNTKTKNANTATVQPAFDFGSKFYYTEELSKLNARENLTLKVVDDSGNSTKNLCVNAESIEALGDFFAGLGLEQRVLKTHLIEVRYLAPTNSRGSRVQFRTFDGSHYKGGKAHTRTVSFDHQFYGTEEQGEAMLKAAGFNVTGMNSQGPTVFFTARWNFETLAKFFKIKSIDINSL